MSKKSRRVAKARRALLALSLVLVTMLVAVGGTIAWLTDTTSAITNTFTGSDVSITLTETKKDFKMVPGATIEKDPKVTVEAGSEDCWLFVKVEKSSVLDKYITYTIATGWNELTGVSGVTGVYYREAKAGDNFPVLANNTVTVKTDVKVTDMEALKANDATQPTLTFTAYAVQKDGSATPPAAPCRTRRNRGFNPRCLVGNGLARSACTGNARLCFTAQARHL